MSECIQHEKLWNVTARMNNKKYSTGYPVIDKMYQWGWMIKCTKLMNDKKYQTDEW